MVLNGSCLFSVLFKYTKENEKKNSDLEDQNKLYCHYAYKQFKSLDDTRTMRWKKSNSQEQKVKNYTLTRKHTHKHTNERICTGRQRPEGHNTDIFKHRYKGNCTPFTNSMEHIEIQRERKSEWCADGGRVFGGNCAIVRIVWYTEICNSYCFRRKGHINLLTIKLFLKFVRYLIR